MTNTQYAAGVTFPSLDLTSFDLRKLEDAADTAAELAKDVVYISVGLAVLELQKAQVRRRELTSLVRRVREQLPGC